MGVDNFLYLGCVLALQHDQASQDCQLRQSRGLLGGRSIPQEMGASDVLDIAVVSSSLAFYLTCRDHGQSRCNGNGQSRCNGNGQHLHVACQTRLRASLAPGSESDDSKSQVEICAV